MGGQMGGQMGGGQMHVFRTHDVYHSTKCSVYCYLC